MKYLRKFATEADASVVAKPNVVLFADTKEVRYNFTKLGVFIQHINGELFTTEQWSAKGFTNEDANGVVVQANEASFVIAKQEYSNQYRYGGAGKLLSNVTTASSKEDAALDFDGFGGSEKMIEELAGYKDSAGVIGAPLAEACVNFVFPNGEKGYLPSCGEMLIAAKQKSQVNAALTLIGGTTISNNNYYTTTQNTATTVWVVWTATPEPSQARKDSTATKCRIFAPLNI